MCDTNATPPVCNLFWKLTVVLYILIIITTITIAIAIIIIIITIILLLLYVTSFPVYYTIVSILPAYNNVLPYLCLVCVFIVA